MRIIIASFLLQLPLGTFAQTCNPPAKINIDLAWTTTAKISWASVSGAMGYQCWIDPSAMPPTSGLNVTDTFTALTNLDADKNYYVHVRTKCGANDFSAWKSQPFKTLATSVNTVGNSTGIIVYPNPASSTVNISGLEKGTEIGISDVAGRIIRTETATEAILEIDVSAFAKGHYFIRAINSSRNLSGSFEIR